MITTMIAITLPRWQREKPVGKSQRTKKAPLLMEVLEGEFESARRRKRSKFSWQIQIRPNECLTPAE